MTAANIADPHHPEPVPAASQLAVLPMLAAIEGYLRGLESESRCRLTVHRVMNRAGHQYLQQVSNYLGYGIGGAGRVFGTDTGIMGSAYHGKQIAHTKHYSDLATFEADLAESMRAVGETKDLTKVAKSYLAIPFAGADDRVILVFYADSFTFNHFADRRIIENVLAMCFGYARLIEYLHTHPLGLIENFPLLSAQDARGSATVYPLVQEFIDDLPIPKLAALTSFNFETRTH